MLARGFFPPAPPFLSPCSAVGCTKQRHRHEHQQPFDMGSGLGRRHGFRGWTNVFACAAFKGYLPGMELAVQMCPAAHDRLLERGWHYGSMSGSMACIEYLEEAGCAWSGLDLSNAILSGNTHVVKCCLDHVRDKVSRPLWDIVMRDALFCQAPQLMRLLYESGFQQRESSLTGFYHPAVLAIVAGTLVGAHVAVKHSGVPAAECTVTQHAALHGEDMLRYAHRFCGRFHEGTAEAAALSGHVGALRYAHEGGAMWDRATLLAAWRATA